MTNLNTTSVFQTRQQMIRDEWTAHWDLVQRRARLWVNKWIAARGILQTLDRDAIIADTIDMAYEAYANKFKEEQPKDITKAIVQFIKLYARNAVRNAQAQKNGITYDDRIDEMVLTTIESDTRESWMELLLELPETSGRELLIKTAVGKASGMFDREIAREIGISHVGVAHILDTLRGLLKNYYLNWLLDKVERKEVQVSPSQYFELLFTL